MSIAKNSWLRTGIALLALVFGVFVAVGAMEKKESVTAETAISTLHWFQVNSGAIDTPIPLGEDGLPALQCTNTEETELCAVGLSPEQVDSAGNPLITDPNDAAEKRYRDN